MKSEQSIMHHGKSQAILAFVQLMNLFLLLQLSDKDSRVAACIKQPELHIRIVTTYGS